MYVSHAIYADHENPMAAIDPTSTGTVDAEVYENVNGVMNEK